MKVVAYLRVSTEQQRDGFGLEAQEHEIRRWARAHRHRLVEVERDEGISGAAAPDKRLGLARALARVQAREADAIVVARLDRLSRDLIMQEQLLSEIRRAGGRLHSTIDAEDQVLVDDPDDPTRSLVRHVIGAVAQWERAMIRLRMQAGRDRKREAGGYYGGQPPYGWRAERGQLIRLEAEQKIIRQIARRRRAGESLRSIADALNANPAAVRRSGGKWWPDTVRELMIREGEHQATEYATRRRRRRSGIDQK